MSDDEFDYNEVDPEFQDNENDPDLDEWDDLLINAIIQEEELEEQDL